MHRPILLLVIIILVPFYKDAQCQCIASGFANGSTFANDASTGSLAFSNPTFAQTNDGNYASATAVAFLLSTANTNYLKATNFGFNLPATAVVCGIEISVIKNASGLNLLSSVTDNKVSLFINGAISGNNYASSTSWGTSDATVVYGGTTDKWGISNSLLTYTNINSANFGVAFSAKVVGLAGLGTSANINQVQAKVYYDVTLLGMELESFTAIKNNGSCFLSWAVNADNSFKNFVLQRSSDLNIWQNISDIQAESNQQQYLFDDENFPAGNNYYRLQIIDLNGAISYSNISLISEQSDESLRIYPNPASDNFTIVAKKTPHIIFLRDEYGRIVKSLTVSTPTDNIKVSIADLKSGVYFVQIDDAALKLWKK